MATEKCTLIPEQLFDSQEAFIAHVKRFAVENGFNVRLDDVERDKGGVIRKRDIVCSSEGAPRGKDAKREESPGRSDNESVDAVTTPKSVAHSGAHRRKSMKTGCRWLARASRQPSGMWKTIMLRLEHNHALTTRYDLALPIAHSMRTGDSSSISAAALAARSAIENGTYTGPSLEFKDLFLQMMSACTDLCWSAARHPETISEVMSEIRRLNQHLEKHGESSSSITEMPTHVPLPTIPEDPRGSAAMTAADSAKSLGSDGSLVMMGHASGSPAQPAHLFGTQHAGAAETPAQIIAQSQNRAIETHSPELNGSTNHNGRNLAPVSGTVPVTASPAMTASAAGPIKRSRGRPRKNPLGVDGKPSRAKPPAKRDAPKDQRSQQRAQTSQVAIAPTPASLATLSQQIISQNVASSPVNAQRPISSSLALPPQNHASGRAPVIGDGSVPSMLDPRTHLNPVQRQPQAPQPQPQQSPTFFLGAAEGNGYSERSAAAAPEHAAVGNPAAATAATAQPYANVAARLGDAAPDFAQKPAAAGVRPAVAAAAAAGVSRYSAAAADAPAAAHGVRSGVLAPAAAAIDSDLSAAAVNPGLSPAAVAAVPRSAAISAISDPAADAPAAVADDAHGYRSPLASAYSHVTVGSPQLGSMPSSVHAHAASFPAYHQHPHQAASYHYQHPQSQHYHNQLARMQNVPSSQSDPSGPRAMFHLNQSIQSTQMGRDPQQAAHIGSYFLVPRSQQLHKQHAEHLVAMPQQSPNAIAALPPMSQSQMIHEHGRRFDELQINPYQSMNNWQM